MLSEIVASVDGVVRVENVDAASDIILVCEHASCRLPSDFGDLGLSEDERTSHIAWDPGALPVAASMAETLGATLVCAEISRLVIDLNRPPDSRGSVPEQSEASVIPGNRGLTDAERVERWQSVYLPFHRTMAALVAGRLAQGRRPAIVTVHSFTPVWFGAPREVELGFIHDADPALALGMLAATQTRSSLKVELNAPYSAADEVTHMLRLHATPFGLPNAMIEIRNDLIASERQQASMAALLAGALNSALASVGGALPEVAS